MVEGQEGVGVASVGIVVEIVDLGRGDEDGGVGVRVSVPAGGRREQQEGEGQ